jgi:hypothetical protein
MVVGVGVGDGRPAPGGGVPTAVPTLVYGPAVATVEPCRSSLAVSSTPSPSASPPAKTGTTPRSSVTMIVDSGTLPGLVTT